MLTDAQRELLEDKFVLWDRASREGSMVLRDYNRRAAEALKVALALASSAEAAEARATQAEQAQDREITALREALERIASYGDGFGPHDPPRRYAGTTGEGHAKCREIARTALSTNHKTGEV